MDDRPLIITDDDEVLEDLLRISAAAGVEVTHSRDPGQRGLWRSASLVLIDAPLVASAVSARLGRRPGVVVVAGDEPDAGLWEQCVRLGEDRTVTLARYALQAEAARTPALREFYAVGADTVDTFALDLVRRAGARHPERDYGIMANYVTGLVFHELALPTAELDPAERLRVLIHALGWIAP